MSTDLVKAFELFSPVWIAAVLQARRAPRWLTMVVLALTGLRSSVPKIIGRTMKAVQLNIGVDMGNALAPWIFCLALDPLIRYAGRVPGVIRFKAYMDDTNTIGDSVRWLIHNQDMWETMTSAGLKIAKHYCIVAKVNDEEIYRGPCATAAARTGQATIGYAGIMYINGIEIRHEQHLDEAGRLTSQAICAVLKTPCSCKGVKTKLIPRSPPNDDILAALDRTPFGARILSNSDRCLGLTAHATMFCDPKGDKQKLSDEQAANISYKPYLCKVEHRATRNASHGVPVHHKLKTGSFLPSASCTTSPRSTSPPKL